MKPLSGSYEAALNTADKYDPDLPLVQSRAFGGTMVMWKREHDPYVSVYTVQSTAFLPIIFHPPGSALSIHIAVYLPTMGLESQFLRELSQLSLIIDELSDTYPSAQLHLRGDFNVSRTNAKRTQLLDHFCSEHDFLQTLIPKATYHHFVGNTESHLDKIFFSRNVIKEESLQRIECGLTNPLIDSHHDLLVSTVSIPSSDEEDSTDGNVVAPVIENKRVKVIWSEQGIEEYQLLIHPHLERLQELWLNSPSKTSVALLLESTNNLLSSCAAKTNRTKSLISKNVSHSSKIPKTI